MNKQELIFMGEHRNAEAIVHDISPGVQLICHNAHTTTRASDLLASHVTEYIFRNIDQKVTVTELAKEFNVSDTHLKNVFKEVHGVPVATFICTQKMQIAAQLLIHTEKPVSEIAYDFGYNNISKFSNAFQKIMGDTPSGYRKEHRK